MDSPAGTQCVCLWSGVKVDMEQMRMTAVQVGRAKVTAWRALAAGGPFPL